MEQGRGENQITRSDPADGSKCKGGPFDLKAMSEAKVKYFLGESENLMFSWGVVVWSCGRVIVWP